MIEQKHEYVSAFTVLNYDLFSDELYNAMILIKLNCHMIFK